MSRIPPDRATPALLLANDEHDTIRATAQGWSIRARLSDGRASRLARIMAGARHALIWQGRDWTISLPMQATGASPTPDSESQPDAVPDIAPPSRAQQLGTRTDLLDQWRTITAAATATAAGRKGRPHA